MKDKAGRKIRVGDEVLYCNDLFEIVGQENDLAVVRSIDPPMGGVLRINPAEITRARSSLLGRLFSVFG